LSDKPHPKRIGASYRGEFGRPEDRVRAAANERRKADLEAHEPLSPEEMPTAQWAAAFDEEVAKYSAEDAATNGGQMVDAVIAGAVTAASERVKAASLTAEQRMA
jgi:hypothetical protein